MVLMERIVRPHVPIDPGASKQTPKCRDPFETTVIKYHAPPGMVNYANQLTNLGTRGGGVKIKDPPKIPDPQEKTKNSSWAYAYKKYMTKKEKEISEPSEEKDGVVQDEEGGKGDTGGGTGKGGEQPGDQTTPRGGDKPPVTRA